MGDKRKKEKKKKKRLLCNLSAIVYAFALSSLGIKASTAIDPLFQPLALQDIFGTL